MTKKRLQHKCFPVDLTKLLRTPFFIKHLYFEDISSPKAFCKTGVLKFFPKFTILQLSASNSQIPNPKGRTRLILRRNVKTKAWERFV